MPGDADRRNEGGAAPGDDRGPGRQASARNQHQNSPQNKPCRASLQATAKLDVLQEDRKARLEVPPKIASVVLGAEQAMKQEIIPASRKRRLPHYRLSRRRGRDHRGERVGSEEGERRMPLHAISIKRSQRIRLEELRIWPPS